MGGGPTEKKAAFVR